MADAFEDLIEAKVLRVLVATAGRSPWGLHGVGMPPVRVVGVMLVPEDSKSFGGYHRISHVPKYFYIHITYGKSKSGR